jgi:hypothetical protein
MGLDELIATVLVEEGRVGVGRGRGLHDFARFTMVLIHCLQYSKFKYVRKSIKANNRREDSDVVRGMCN